MLLGSPLILLVGPIYNLRVLFQLRGHELQRLRVLLDGHPGDLLVAPAALGGMPAASKQRLGS